jgi:preprotein translocase subunit SecB
MKKSMGFLEFRGSIAPALWDYEIGIRQPAYVKEKKYYACGLDCKVFLFPNKIEEVKKKAEDALLYIETGIAGIFSAVNENKDGQEQLTRFNSDLESKLVRIQMPAILMPYLRGAITSFLANAGFGAVLFPLINVQELADKTLKDIEIKEI